VILIAQNHLGGRKLVFITNIIVDYNKPIIRYGYGITLTKGFSSEMVCRESRLYELISQRPIVVAQFFDSMILQVDASISSSLKDTPSILYDGIVFLAL
jgi:hypothetical protein